MIAPVILANSCRNSSRILSRNPFRDILSEVSNSSASQPVQPASTSASSRKTRARPFSQTEPEDVQVNMVQCARATVVDISSSTRVWFELAFP